MKKKTKMSVSTNTPNLTLYSRTNFYTEFKATSIKTWVPDVKRVIYYICPWHFHELPDKEEFKREGIECEIVTLQHFDTEALIKTIQEQVYEIQTLVIIQRILPFQREAWGHQKI